MSNTDQQQFYANPGPHSTAPTYFVQGNPIETGYAVSARNGVPIQTRMPAASLNYTHMQGGYAQPYFVSTQYTPSPFMPQTNHRQMNPQISVRAPHEQMNNYSAYMSANGYPAPYPPGNTAISSGTALYSTAPAFYPNYQVAGPYASSQVQSQIPNQPQLSQLAPYGMGHGPQPTQQSMHAAQPAPMPQIDTIPVTQSQMGHTHAQQNSYGQQSTAVILEKRKKHPLLILDPVSHKPVEVHPSSTSSSTTSTSIGAASVSTTMSSENRSHEITSVDSTAPIPKSSNNTTSLQVQSDFRKKIADALQNPSNVQLDKGTPQQPPSSGSHEEQSVSTTLKQDSTKPPESQTKQVISSESSFRPGSISRPKSPISISSNDTSMTPSNETTFNKPNEQAAQKGSDLISNSKDDTLPVNVNDDDVKDKDSRSNSVKQSDSESIESTEKPDIDPNPTSDDATSIVDQETSSILPESRSTTSSFDGATPPQTPTIIQSEKSQVTSNQRLRYDRQELLRIRDSSAPFPIPQNLPDLDIVINRRDNNNQRFSYSGTNSQGRINPQFTRALSSSNHPSLTRYSNNSNLATDSRRKQAIYLSNEPDFGNRVENPYKPMDQSKVDANNKILREIKSILNKVTPQTYDKLQKKLEELEIDRYERLEGMIIIFFSKAVDEPAFSFLYAKLCKQFQKRQVSVPSDDGKIVTYCFRQILLTRCQKEFESDYRQEIEYEKRKLELESITDEKKHKEEAEKLEEDLVKAKRRKLGNIFFIGELFKLQMLTDTIMYDCIEYLLRDRTDEESLECLCRLVRTIGKELDLKAAEKQQTKVNLEKYYRELENIVKEQKISARIRFMIQDLLELRQASWVARRAEAKPTTIDEIHEQERLKREQQEREQERERQQRRDQNRPVVIGTAYNNSGQQQYNDGRGSRGSGIRQPSNRNDEDRIENRFNVNSVRQLQSNDKRNQGSLAMSLAPQRTWTKGSGIEKKQEEDRPTNTAGRTGKPPAGPVQQFKGKMSTSQSASGYPIQRQSSRELARENSQRDRESALQSLRKTTTGSGVNSPVNIAGTSSMANSREGSRNVSREQSRNASRESSVSERTSNVGSAITSSKESNESTTIINPDPSNTTFDEEKTKARVHSLIEEYTENYSNFIDRPVKEALEDLAAFRTPSFDQQAIIVRELFTNVLEARPRARRAVGHLLDAAHNKDIISEKAFLHGVKLIIEVVPDYAVDIPLIWQYIGEIFGAFIGAPTSNMRLLKPIFECVPYDKAKQLFQYIIRYATEFSSRARIQSFWQSSGFSFNDLLKSDLIDPAFSTEFSWLFDKPEIEQISLQIKESHSPHADPQLVKLFKSVTDQNTAVTDPEIITYIRERMDSNEKFYIRNIVLSYLEACLIIRDSQKKIQEEIAKHRMTVLNAVIEHKPEAEIQAVYAIQNFVHRLEHPPKMARLLFDIFYDEECVSEDAFFEWLKHPDQSETDGHAVVELSTKDFFTWLLQAETEVEEGEEEEGN